MLRVRFSDLHGNHSSSAAIALPVQGDIENGWWAWLWIGFLLVALLLAFERHRDPFPAQAELVAARLGLSREWGLARSNNSSSRMGLPAGGGLGQAGELSGSPAQSDPVDELWGRLSVRELRLLPGLGDTRARALVRAREEVLPGARLPRLAQIPGIGEITERRVLAWLRERAGSSPGPMGSFPFNRAPAPGHLR